MIVPQSCHGYLVTVSDRLVVLPLTYSQTDLPLTAVRAPIFGRQSKCTHIGKIF